MGLQDMVTSYFLSSILSNLPNLIVGIVLILFSIFLLRSIKNFIFNAIAGIILLFFVNYLGLSAPITVATIAVSLLFGPAGVGVILVLTFFGVALS